jgi:hypothetical protein
VVVAMVGEGGICIRADTLENLVIYVFIQS